jgi:ABC-type xylose transport system permease subunit
MDAKGQSAETPKKLGIGEYLVRHMREYGLLFALIAIMLFFQVVTNGTLLKPVNVTNLCCWAHRPIGRLCDGFRWRFGGSDDR